jgi:ABC-type branched-subunit amino acid transport system ATPase component
LLAEQNARAALAACDRALLMRLGSVVGEGTPREISGDERLARVMMGG